MQMQQIGFIGVQLMVEPAGEPGGRMKDSICGVLKGWKQVAEHVAGYGNRCPHAFGALDAELVT